LTSILKCGAEQSRELNRRYYGRTNNNGICLQYVQYGGCTCTYANREKLIKILKGKGILEESFREYL